MRLKKTREREITHPHSPEWPQWPKLGQFEALVLELLPVLPRSCPFSSTFPGHQKGAGQDVEQPEF